MRFIRKIEESDATGEIGAMYARRRAERGRVSNILKARSGRPQALAQHLHLCMGLRFGTGKLARAQREIIALVASAANDCDYCVSHHREAPARNLHDPAQLKAICSIPHEAEQAPPVHVLLDYVQKLTRAPGSIRPAGIGALRAFGFAQKGILHANLVAGYFDFVNRIALGVGVAFNADEIVGYKGMNALSISVGLGRLWVRRSVCAMLMLTVLSAMAAETSFDHRHPLLDGLLARHVHWVEAGHASVVDYAGLKRERQLLQAYLRSVSGVERDSFDTWEPLQRRAFLINAYNAFTLELVLSRYPDLESIKDLGGLFTSPWKQRFFSLLGEQRHLDDVEHGLIRGATDFNDPRIHFAVNCASVGCPALRPEAYRAELLDRQLDDQTRRFLGDRSRNRADAGASRLVLSSIFKWYEGDFSRGLRGAHSVAEFVSGYPDAIGLTPADVIALRDGEWTMTYSDYDWSLNQLR